MAIKLWPDQLMACSLVIATALLLLLLPPQSVLAQEEPASVEDEEGTDSEEDSMASMREILKIDRELNEDKLFSYDPAGRRDPFKSLLRSREAPPDAPEVRPPGLPGMLIEELLLEGIIETPSGILGVVQGRDNLSHMIYAGTKLFNGEVAEIHPTKVIFKQYVNDPNRLNQYDEIVRKVAD